SRTRDDYRRTARGPHDSPPEVRPGGAAGPRKARPRENEWLGEGGLEQSEHPAPGALGLLLVVDVGIDDGPAVRRALVNLDLGLEARRVERFAEHVLRFRLALVVVLRDRDQEARAHARDQEMGAVLVAGHEPAAVERAAGAHALRHGCRGAHHDRTAHAVADRADL